MFLAASSKEIHLFPSGKVSERACDVFWAADRSHQGWTCRSRVPKENKQYLFGNAHLEQVWLSWEHLCHETLAV